MAADATPMSDRTRRAICRRPALRDMRRRLATDRRLAGPAILRPEGIRRREAIHHRQGMRPHLARRLRREGRHLRNRSYDVSVLAS